jgi:hypothetical protein
MARPIEATPVLRGKYALEFIKTAENPKPYTPRVMTPEKLEKLEKRIAEFAQKHAKK